MAFIGLKNFLEAIRIYISYLIDTFTSEIYSAPLLMIVRPLYLGNFRKVSILSSNPRVWALLSNLSKQQEYWRFKYLDWWLPTQKFQAKIEIWLNKKFWAICSCWKSHNFFFVVIWANFIMIKIFMNIRRRFE